LDNYLFPLATRLSRLAGRKFVSVWGTKRHAEESYICIAQAVPAGNASAFGHVIKVRTSASSGSTAYKQQIHEQLLDAATLPDGPVGLQMHFTVGPRRSWPNLWKPTIDALGQILGRTKPDLLWPPRDGRIVEIGLHNHVDSSMGHDVAITIAACTK
jgi:hypothetical protein